MTVTTQVSKNSMYGNGTTGPYSFSFKIFQPTDLTVYKDGVALTYLTDYTVSINPVSDGGTINFTVAPQTSDTLIFIRDMALTQTLNLPTEDRLPPIAMNNAFDRAVMLIQQQQEQLSRALLLAVTNTAESNLVLPSPVAGLCLQWDPTATYLQNTTYDPDLLGAAAAGAAASASEAATSASSSATSATAAAASAATAAADTSGIIAGTTTLVSVTTTGNVTAGGSLSVTNNASIGGNLTLTGNMNGGVPYTTSNVVGNTNYVRFPVNSTGTIPMFQWAVLTAANGSTGVTFPTPFPNACDAIVLGIAGNATGLYWSSKTASGFTINNTSGAALNFSYFAIGH